MIKNLLYLLIILAGIPVGSYLAKLCKEEIKNWKKRLIAIIILCFIFSIFIFFSPFTYRISIIVALLFTIIVFTKIISQV
jgi:xanthine/uracil permease